MSVVAFVEYKRHHHNKPDDGEKNAEDDAEDLQRAVRPYQHYNAERVKDKTVK